jgi:endogenous inhibitor of DNA gyrase (YacG/DUF329 family)
MVDTLKQKVAYLQGLAEGLDVNPGDKEGKIMANVIQVLGDVAGQIEDLRTAQEELEDYLESIDDDLNDLESELSFADDDLIEVECPKCHKTVMFDSDILEDDDTIEVTCPNCNEVVFVNDGSFDIETRGVDDELADAKTDEDI